MALSEPVHAVRRLGSAAQIGAIVMAEQAIDSYLDDYGRPGDRATALDILLRDLARLRFVEPDLDAFIGEVERYIDLLYRDLARQAA
ncbi:MULTISPECIES: hypothetical protein [unclassified Methylobacterium]|uniref:hypothetical protein n=1 Tax=unclassified Methylobacterium TaxID=2615210 RepID=UPI0011C20A33|nr:MULTISPECIES: hypothetical protein [unclassified Methylobacterium]QEE40481.1 hypothetical protein FVA80_17375 [Methylobacterium sp. WL1]TXN05494.1 hypothetical protein FV242_03980 [Methylobacterium sp. WL64]TXN59189.1 hypothetical protein FV241_03155 [Methylobacterium sp. WL2]